MKLTEVVLQFPSKKEVKPPSAAVLMTRIKSCLGPCKKRSSRYGGYFRFAAVTDVGEKRALYDAALANLIRTFGEPTHLIPIKSDADEMHAVLHKRDTGTTSLPTSIQGIRIWEIGEYVLKLPAFYTYGEGIVANFDLLSDCGE